MDEVTCVQTRFDVYKFLVEEAASGTRFSDLLLLADDVATWVIDGELPADYIHCPEDEEYDEDPE
jgi:hypothetical protein